MKTQLGRSARPGWIFSQPKLSITSTRRAYPVRATSRPSTENITQRIFRQIEERSVLDAAAGGAGGGTRYADLKRVDAAWTDLRTRTVYGLPPQFVRRTKDKLPATPGLDVVVAGGTLGIFLAGSLQAAGLRVAVLERGPLRGRSQEWNVSRKELRELVEMSVMSEAEAEECISIEFNPVRVGFHGKDNKDVWTQNVLNLGCNPQKLVELARRRFEANGGLVFEETSLSEVWIHPNGVQLRLGDAAPQGGSGAALAAKLLVDAMGNASPIVRQVRHGRKPDGVCLVVGTCARGFPAEKNTTGDVIYTATPSEPPSASHIKTEESGSGIGDVSNLQAFWEAFPAGSGPTDRTTYLFTYLDAHPDRPSLESLLEYYWREMPQYQGVSLEDLQVQRVLFGMFPTYRDSPLPPQFDRVLAVGDASGIQSPLSFGGFGAMLRHLRRLTGAISGAVEAGALDMRGLKFINAYNPSLSGAWMLQRAMSIPAQSQRYDVNFINRLLGGNFAAMERQGDATLKPFLQDVIQAGPLARTLVAQMASDPVFVPQILMRVGVGPMADWLLHFVGLVGYTAAFKLAQRCELAKRAEGMPARQRYILERAVERWQYGAGLDYEL